MKEVVILNSHLTELVNRTLSRIIFIVLVTCNLSMVSNYCFAQAVPDTSLNNIIDDTSRQRKPVPDTSAHVTVTSAADASPLIPVKKGPFQPNPKKAALYSALFPGLGQIYNRQYWKVPLVYAAVGVAGYYYIKNRNNYVSYRRAYVSRLANANNPIDEYAKIYTNPDQLRQLQDDSKRYLDLTVLLSGVGYALQVLDAITSAHLKNFDISRDISMRMIPVVTPNGGVGFGLAVNFR